MQAAAAAPAQIARARLALRGPYLVPGDREVLRLRIRHPQLTMGELGHLAGMSKAAFSAKFRGACNRGPMSSPPDPENQWLPPGKAAGYVGVTTTMLRVLADRGTLPARRNRQYYYRIGDLEEVRRMLGETMMLVVGQLTK